MRGDGILLSSIQPGDILQFRDHVVDVGTWKEANGKWYEASGRTLTRPHHTAIVIEVRKDGSVLVVEQNVHPNPVSAYRPIPKPEKGARLLGPGRSAPAGGTRMLANVVPSQGGSKRVPGSLGMHLPRPANDGEAGRFA